MVATRDFTFRNNSFLASLKPGGKKIAAPGKAERRFVRGLRAGRNSNAKFLQRNDTKKAQKAFRSIDILDPCS